jgi:ABC-type uncharacterized transport system permease subunit
MTADTTARRPSLVAGTIIGVIIAALFSVLFALLAGVSIATAPVFGVVVLLAAWAVWCAVAYGTAADDDDPETSH